MLSISKLYNKHFYTSPIDNSALVLFRAVFGLLITLEAGGAIATGWVKRIFVDPTFHFTFIGFEWLDVLKGEFMYAYFAMMAIAGVFIMLGLFYRPAMLIYAIMWSGVYLAQKTAYNNHYYLLMLLCWIMVFMPANRRFSLDSKRKPEILSYAMPNGIRWFWIAQITIVYTYAAIAKIYPDWLAGKFVEISFHAKKDWPIIGSFLTLPYMDLLVSYTAILFDGLISPLLLWKKTRKWAFISSLIFHLFNSLVFHIGIFPFMSISFALFFYPPETIANYFQRIIKSKSSQPTNKKATNSYIPNWVFGIATVYLLIQLILPLRHWVIPGNVLWNEAGHRCSWRMMLRSKSGKTNFIVLDKKGEQKVLHQKD